MQLLHASTIVDASLAPPFRIQSMARSSRIAAALALAATAACSTEPTAPTLESSSDLYGAKEGTSGGRIVVSETDITRQPENTPPTDNWVFYFRLPTSTGAFVTGPGNPPLGVGSFEMNTPTDGDKGTLFNFDHIATRLADISDIGYATYRRAESTDGVSLPSINIQVDKDGGALLPGDFLTLVYEPYLNGATIQEGVWQTWDAIPGTWWATRPIILADGSACAPQICTFTWSAFVAAYPNATITGGFGVNQGSFNGGLFAATDALTIEYDGNRWTYDFEPFRGPANRDECKKGGWENLRDENGAPFKNQGQCVSYANRTSRS